MGMLSTDDDQKPLFRTWLKQQKRLGIPEQEIIDTVESIRLSNSEEWILIEGENSVAMINAESKVGKEFWSTIETFNGVLKALQIVPAKGKLGFDLEPKENSAVYWVWEDTKVTCEVEKSTRSGFASKISLDLMKIGMPISEKLEDGQPSGKRGKKATNAQSENPPVTP